MKSMHSTLILAMVAALVLTTSPAAMAGPHAKKAITFNCRTGMLTALRSFKKFSFKKNAVFLLQNIEPKIAQKYGTNQFALHDAAQHRLPAIKKLAASAPKKPLFVANDAFGLDRGHGGEWFNKNYDFKTHQFPMTILMSNHNAGTPSPVSVAKCPGPVVVDIKADNASDWIHLPIKMSEKKAEKFIKNRTKTTIGVTSFNDMVYLVWRIQITGFRRAYSPYGDTTHLVLNGHILSATIYGDKGHHHVLQVYNSPPDGK